jgi:hypothetical protein
VHSVATAAPSALTVGAAQNAGTSTSLVRADHVHAMPAAGTPVALTLAGANAPGSAATLALSDHVHALPATAAPAALTVGGSSSAGVAVTLPRSDHVHAMPALVTTSVDGFMSAADKSKLDGVEAGAQVTTFARVQTALAAASSAVSINAQRLTSVADPSSAQDAATKAYVDAIAQGLDIKASVRLVATSNVAALTGNVSIDGSTTAPGQRVLLAGQTTASANGPYLTAAGAWARTTDADTSAKVTAGMYVFVTEGAANADSGWALITPDPIVLGTTALTFTQVTGAGQITAGGGMTKTGNTLDVVAHADGSIVVAADSVQVGVLATDTQHGTRGGGTLHAAVIAAGAAGFMSGADKTKLDGIATGAAAVLSVTPNAVDGSTGNGGAAATASRSDHRHQVTTGTPNALSMGAATAAGTSNNLVRADHIHALPAAGTPVALTLAGANAPGSAATLALSDHVHALPASSTAPPALTVGGSSSAGSSTSISKADHVHALAAPTVVLETIGLGSLGASTAAAREDHQHASAWKAICAAVLESVGFDASAPPSTVDGITIVAGDYILVDGRLAPLADADPVPLTGELLGIFRSLGATWLFLETLDQGEVAYVKSTDSLWTYNGSQYVELYERVGSSTPTQIYAGRTAHPGVVSEAARPDHIHNILTGAPSTLTASGTNTEGTGQPLARADHVHSVATGTPVGLTVGGSSAPGSSANLVRADHVHGMPNTATTGAAGFMSAADKARVDVGALPYSASVAANTWTIANSSGTKTLPSPAVLGDTVAIVVTNTGVNIAAGSGNTIIDANSSGYSTLSSVPSPAVYTFRCAVGGFWFMGDNLANTTIPGLMSASDKSKLNGVAAGADPTIATLAAASASISVNGQRIQNVGAPGSANDAATQNYVDTQIINTFSVLQRVNQCRLSGQQQFAVMDTDNAAITSLYLVPYTGDVIWLYSATYNGWRPFRAAANTPSIALTGLTAGRPYDVFAYATPAFGQGTVANLELLAWASTSARATALVDQNGVWTKSGDITRRYVGTIYARTASSCAWVRNGYNTATAQCDIWNAENRVPAVFTNSTLWTGSFATATANTWFQIATSYKTELIVGRVLTPLDARMSVGCNTAGTANAGYIDIQLNGAGAGAARVLNTAGEILQLNTAFMNMPALGYNALTFMALGTATAVLFYTTDDPAGTPPVYAYGCFTRHEY